MFISILDGDVKTAWTLFIQARIIGTYVLQLGQTVLQYET